MREEILKLCETLGWQNPNGSPASPFLYHGYTISEEQKAREMLALLAVPDGQMRPLVTAEES